MVSFLRRVLSTLGNEDRQFAIFLFALSTLSFLVYLHIFTQSGRAIPIYPDWSFAFDNYANVLDGTSDTVAGYKHPAYVMLARPLFGLGITLFDGESSIDGFSRAIIFPSALFGSINLFLAGIIFRRNTNGLFTAIGFSLLYSFSSVSIFVSSFPDTYSLTGLAGTTFFLLLLNHGGDPPAKILALANAIFSFAAPQKLFLAIVPGIRKLMNVVFGSESIGAFFRWLVWYSAILISVFIVPYLLYLEFLGPGWFFPRAYLGYVGEPENISNIQYFFNGFMHHAVYSVIAPPIDWRLYLDGPLTVLKEAPIMWLVCLVIHLLFVTICLVKLPSTSARIRPFLWPLAMYAIFYVTFFVFFIPGEPYLASHGLLLPWLLVLQAGFSELRWRGWNALMALMVCTVAVNSVA